MAAKTKDNFYALSTDNQQLQQQQQQKQKNPHIISSDIRQPGRSITVFKSKAAKRNDYGLYLKGMSYQLFKQGIKEERTLEFYRRQLFFFCEFTKKTTEEIVSLYGPFIVVDGKRTPNIEGPIELQQLIQKYILMLQERVSVGEIKPTTCVSMIPPIRLFCEMNDIILNWKKINRLLPRSDLNAQDEAYTRDKIKKMIAVSDLRTRLIILAFSSSGVRLGGLEGLMDGDISPIYDPKDRSNLLAASVIVYRGTDEEYITFFTPETYRTYHEYRQIRIKFGEKITDESPFILNRFCKTSLQKGRVKPVRKSTIPNLITAVAVKAGIREPSKHYKSRFRIKNIHGFRKFFNTTLRSIKTKDGLAAIDYINKERMLGHALINQHALEENYDRSDMVKVLLEDYLKAVPELTISDEERLNLQVKKLETDITNYRTLDVELSEKDREIREMKEQMKAMQESQAEMREMLKHPEKLAEIIRENESST